MLFYGNTMYTEVTHSSLQAFYQDWKAIASQMNQSELVFSHSHSEPELKLFGHVALEYYSIYLHLHIPL